MKAVLFDFGGTLDSDGLTWGDRFYPLYKEAGIDFPRERFNQAFYRSDDSLPARFDLKGLSLEKTVMLQVTGVLEDLAPDRGDLAASITSRFVNDCRRFFTRNRPMLERLAKRFKLGIVSNWYGNMSGILASENLAALFSVVADSTAVGHLKPAREIFMYAADALEALPLDCLMVGDSVGRDMKGAENLYMPHALLNPAANACCKDGWRLNSLSELEARLS